jgi:N-acetylmuramidase/LysM domain
VRPGDTLSGIAERHGTTVAALVQANGIADPNLIFPGDALRLPGRAAPTAPSAPAAAPDAPAAVPEGRVQPGRLPDTTGLSEAQRYDLYAAQVQQFGDAGAQADLAAGRRVIVSLRQDTSTLANEGRGVYDDRMVVLWRDADGTRHAVELAANTDPSGQYEDGGPYMRRAVGGNYGGDARGDQGRLVEGTYVHTRGSFLGATALMAGSDQVTERDTNHDGRFTEGVRTDRGAYGMHIHIGGQNNTYSAGCLTLAPAEHARLFEALGSQNTVRTVLVDTRSLTPSAAASAPTAPAAPATPATAGAPLTDADWQRAATALGVDVAAIRAVAEVEARRSGFLEDGRPKILFEAHQFSDRTGGRFNRSHPDISSPRWNRDLYVGGAGEYPRLERAMALDRTAALESASWGRFQIMGFNHEAAGFADVESFVAAMRHSEGRQLDAFVNFIRSDPAMHRALQQHDWAGFAYRYNGEGYAANQYDTRMAEAYRRFAH